MNEPAATLSRRSDETTTGRAWAAQGCVMPPYCETSLRGVTLELRNGDDADGDF